MIQHKRHVLFLFPTGSQDFGSNFRLDWKGRRASLRRSPNCWRQDAKAVGSESDSEVRILFDRPTSREELRLRWSSDYPPLRFSGMT